MLRVLILSISLITALFILQACNGQQEQAKSMDQIYAEQGVPVRITKVETRQFKQTLRFNTVVNGLNEASANASFGGRIDKIFIKVGDYVKKDQVLMAFPTDHPAANYKQAKTAYENAKKALERIQNVNESGGVSTQTLDNVQAQYDVANANWDAVRKAVFAKAPISGYVTQVNVTETQSVEKEFLLATISQTKKLKAKVWIKDQDILSLSAGQPATATWNGRSINGKLTQLDLSMDMRHQAFGAILEFENPANTIRSGVTCEIELENYRNERAIVLARKDILKENDHYYVYLNAAGKALKQKVTPGRRNGLDVEILSGLKVGDPLITEGQLLLSDNVKIKIVE